MPVLSDGNIRRPPLTRTDRVCDACDNGIVGCLLILLCLAGLAVTLALSTDDHWLFALIPAAVCVGTSLFIWMIISNTERRTIEIAKDSHPEKVRLLREIVKTYESLPALMRPAVRPVLEPAFTIAAGAAPLAGLRDRRELLGLYAEEAFFWERKLDPLSDEDLEVARAALEGLRGAREAGEVR